MASNNATLGYLLPHQTVPPMGGQAAYMRYGTAAALRFDDSNPEYVEFDCFLPRPTAGAAAGYTGTTGVKLNLFWNSADKKVAGAVKWVAQIVPAGQTDLPDPTVDLWSSTYEATTTTTTNATGGGLNKTTISVTIANIQGAQTTAPAVGDFIRIRIRREAADAADTLVGYALLFGVELQDY